MGRPKISLDKRLKTYVLDIETGCHIWTKQVTDRGYPLIWFNNKMRRAHKIAYEFYKEPISGDLVIRHQCHNRRCINVEHMILGTQADNIADAVKAGRNAKGSKNGHTHLTEADVIKIRELIATGLASKTVAKMFNLSWSATSHIKHRKTWRHV